MNTLWEFLSMSDANVRFVTIGSILLAASSAVVGCFTVLRKRALVGDAVAHAVLPGVCLAFMLTGEKNPLVLLLGSFLTGWLSLVIIDAITAHSRIKEDTAIGLVLSVFFGIGILLLTAIQHSGNEKQSGLDKFLFGSAAALVGQDLITFGAVAVLLLLSVLLLYKEFKLISFDMAYARTIGLPVRGLELLLTTLTVLAVVVGIQSVGVVLMSAMLITPAAAARFWTDRLGVMIFIAAAMSAFCGAAGAYVSFTAPAMPTGPWIVMLLSLLAIFSFIMAPKKGLLARYLLQRRLRNQMTRENILKTLFLLGETKEEFGHSYSRQQIMERRKLPLLRMQGGLKALCRQNLVKKDSAGWALTDAGRKEAQRVVRLHRLWELYLTQYLQVASDHVHEDAESIEHVLTPELEKRLEELLNYPTTDPHQTIIPQQP
ncbi:metal ABC transporter permease [Rufibacter glacialis]|uniref:Iron chelate uptake ABC transporter family permease subunit n=1 Tax=Rufibacter glacialis TaxID=1259555 RepID=A0A5M8Q9U4_9BACT|nr:metal ABC transporter permease [Rufibacter glacialis]KAA6431918.1 iron chelate uptake ABC transporter family permease subunit [Rufibacter glacialis]GGK80434.1 manganese transport system membrane protein MntC [Rufibacter glacialis]